MKTLIIMCSFNLAFAQSYHSRHTTLIQRQFNADSTSRRWINVESTLFWHCVPAGISVVVVRTYHTWWTLLLILLLNMLLLSKIRAFRAGFQSGHYHILWTSHKREPNKHLGLIWLGVKVAKYLLDKYGVLSARATGEYLSMLEQLRMRILVILIVRH